MCRNPMYPVRYEVWQRRNPRYPRQVQVVEEAVPEPRLVEAQACRQ